MRRTFTLVACIGAALLIAAISLSRASADKAVAASPSTTEPAVPRRVKVLWLGDDGHHVPLERCRQVFSTMAEHGIDFTYTQDIGELNPGTLNRYDCLFLYANITRIAPQQEKALLDYVESGHGFVPIHCGSYCFLNSPAITALTGARFKSHGTGVFKETIAQPDHPIEKGLKPIESWDESYVHEMHNEKDRTVLSYRDKEPYTWVRTQGKGRVFYTAWGHDERTWGNADFQALLERGIRWAAGDWAMQPQHLPPLAEVDSGAPIPNYLPSQKWGTEGAPLMRMQAPASPDDSMKHMVLPPNITPSLYAADPQIMKPICMAFDERGRLWVAETFDYPNNMQPAGEGHDRITICEDTNGDGKADKFTVFADKLSIPTSICFANGGVLVTQAPDMLFFQDTNGDGKADVKKVLFTGWGTRDTHAGPSNLRYGFDGWVYGTVGYSGFKGEVGGQDVSFGAGVFRMKPDGSKLEFLGSTTNNTWGLGISEDNQIFGSTANDNPSWYMHIPNRYYEQVRGWTVRQFGPIADSAAIFPATEKVRQMDHHGKYTAGAGSALYTARSFPQDYWNRIEFVAEPTAHLLGQFIIEPKGSAFTTRNDFNLLSSTDEWTAPIAGEVGPDGAVWMIDWYNFIVQHNPIPKGFVSGKGGAYVTPLRDKRHGRVYRLIYDGAKPSEQPKLAGASTEQLVAALKNDNMLWRMHAQRLLLEKGDRSAIPALAAMAKDASVDAIGLNAPVIHALWTLKDLGALDDANPDAAALASAEAALKHRSAGVRRAALDVLPRTAKSTDEIVKGRLLEDHDPQVRKAALLALSEMPASDAAGAAIYASLSLKQNADDRWITDAIAIAGSRHDADFLRSVFAAHPGTSAVAAVEPAETAPKPHVNLLPNPSFEEIAGKAPKGWHTVTYSGSAVQDVASPGRTGDRCVRLHSDAGSDTSWTTTVPVNRDTDYTLTGWIKVDGVKPVGRGLGALFNIHGTPFKSRAVTGTSNWQKVAFDFNSGSLTNVTVNCLFGGWGHATGTAYYDDLELAPSRGGHSIAKSLGGANGEGKVVEAIVNQYARRGPVESVVATVKGVKNVDPALAAVVLDALAAGWPKETAPKLSEADVADLRATMTDLHPDARDRLIALAERWGRHDLFGAQFAAATKEMKALVADGEADTAKRAEAARRLVALEDTPESVNLVVDQINPQAAPEVQSAMLDALSASHNASVGESLLSRWSKLTPTAQRAALNLLLRREAWTTSLLASLKSGTVNTKDLLPQQWEALTGHPNPKIAAAAKTLQKSAGRATSPDRKAIVEKGLPLAAKQGDATKGRLVFEKNCIVCHTIEGQGGKVGPDLTGIGARPKADNLIDILDPNRSVEGTYRQWIAKTDDDVIAGRLLSESKTSIEIIDPAGKVHPLQRDEIKRLTASDRSVMPEGFEQLPPEDLTNLLEYLATSRVKH